MIPVSEAVRRIPGRANVTQNQMIIFKSNLPALGFNTYYFEKKTEQTVQSKVKVTENDACVLQNQYLRVEIDAQGNLVQIINLNKSLSVPFTSQGFYWYEGFPDDVKEQDHQASGAYVFRPYNQTAQPVSTSRTMSVFSLQKNILLLIF
jgi:lysosomal alpha-mannosidase